MNSNKKKNTLLFNVFVKRNRIFLVIVSRLKNAALQSYNSLLY